MEKETSILKKERWRNQEIRSKICRVKTKKYGCDQSFIFYAKSYANLKVNSASPFIFSRRPHKEDDTCVFLQKWIIFTLKKFCVFSSKTWVIFFLYHLTHHTQPPGLSVDPFAWRGRRGLHLQTHLDAEKQMFPSLSGYSAWKKWDMCIRI